MKIIKDSILVSAFFFLCSCGGGDDTDKSSQKINLQVTESHDRALMNVTGLDTKSYVVKNNSDSTLVLAVSTSGLPKHFVVADECNGKTLEASKSCIINVSYTGSVSSQGRIEISTGNSNDLVTIDIFGLEDPLGGQLESYSDAVVQQGYAVLDVELTENEAKQYHLGPVTQPNHTLNAWGDLDRGGYPFTFNAPYIQTYNPRPEQFVTPLVVKRSCGSNELYFVTQYQRLASELHGALGDHVFIKFHSIFADGVNLGGAAGRNVTFSGQLDVETSGGDRDKKAIDEIAHENLWSPASGMSILADLLGSGRNSYVRSDFRLDKISPKANQPSSIFAINSMLDDQTAEALLRYMETNTSLADIHGQPSDHIPLNDITFQQSIRAYRELVATLCKEGF